MIQNCKTSYILQPTQQKKISIEQLQIPGGKTRKQRKLSSNSSSYQQPRKTAPKDKEAMELGREERSRTGERENPRFGHAAKLLQDPTTLGDSDRQHDILLAPCTTDGGGAGPPELPVVRTGSHHCSPPRNSQAGELNRRSSFLSRGRKREQGRQIDKETGRGNL